MVSKKKNVQINDEDDDDIILDVESPKPDNNKNNEH